MPGVVAVLPVYARHLAFPAGGGSRLDAYVMAIAAPHGMQLPGDAWRYFPAPGHMVIDRVLAAEARVKQGGQLHVLGHTLLVDRLTSGGNKIVQFAFLNPTDGKTLLG